MTTGYGVFLVLKLFSIFFLFISLYFIIFRAKRKLIQTKKRKQNNNKKQNKKNHGEELLGSQARWRVIPRPHDLIYTRGEVIRPPSHIRITPIKCGLEPTTLRSGVARLSPLDHLRCC